MWRRTADRWEHAVHGAGERLELPSIHVSLDVNELYEAAGVNVA